MTEGGVSNGLAPRLRIKGRAPSVLRFFSISVAFMILWILVTSQLGHYSKLFGPQILLQLNLAFYIPSIPVLLLSGSLERALDERLGPIGSIALRLNSGLGGCLLVAALFPLLPGLRPGDGPLWPVLAAVAVLGGLSAVAFSTSYQLVQFFRAADTIGLGVGCVGAGPLVLFIQLALQVGPSPARWQWIALYEICAGFILAGLLSSLSLCGQYWDLLNESASRGAAAAAAAAGGGGSGAADGGGSAASGDAAEGRVPLLLAADEAATAAVAAEAAAADIEAATVLSPGRSGSGGGSGGVSGFLYGSPSSPSPATYGKMRVYGSGGLRVRAGRPLVLRPAVAPDPSNVLTLLSPGPDGRLGWAADQDDNDLAPPLLLRRSVSAGIERGSAAAIARRREALAAAALDRSQGSRPKVSLVSQFTAAVRHQLKPRTPPSTPETRPAAAAAAAATPGSSARTAGPAATPLSPPTATTALLLSGMASAPAAVGHKRLSAEAEADDSGAAGGPGGVDLIEFGDPDPEPVAQPSFFVDIVGTPSPSAAAAVGDGGCGGSMFATPAAASVLLSDPVLQAGDGAEGAGAGEVTEAEAGMAGVKVDVEVSGPSAAVSTAPMTVHQEVVEVVRGAWQVLLGFLVSVTTLYIVFPFFTYVPHAGWMGDSLPQVLFYARLFTDLAGRLLPRSRSLQLRSGAAVLSLASASTAAAALFFIYILAPASWARRAPGLLHNDLVPVALVVFLWLSGGYTNTISNMLAPSLVAPELAGRASAVMALLFNVAHIGGLVIAAAMAAGIFGDVVG